MNTKIILVMFLLLGTALLSAEVHVYVVGSGPTQWEEVCLKCPGVQYYEYGDVPGVIRFNVNLNQGDLIKACITLNGVDYWSPRTQYEAPITNLIIVTP